MFGGKLEEDISDQLRLKLFLALHWRGALCLVTPLILILIFYPFKSWPLPIEWFIYTLLLMTIYWATRCIPLEITAFIPVFLFPMTKVMTTSEVCNYYVNETTILLLGIFFLAFALEQCGVLKRLAYFFLSMGCSSHGLMVFIIFQTTAFISAFLPNSAATALMTPIVLNVLKSFEYQGVMKIHENNRKGEKVATALTTCYMSAISYAATFGGVLTLIGTATNLTFKGLYQQSYPLAPDALTFVHFIAHAVIPNVLATNLAAICMILMYCGENRANKMPVITEAISKAVQKAIDDEADKIKEFTFWEGVVLCLYFIALMLLTFQYPIINSGLSNLLASMFGRPSGFIQDSAFAIIVCFILFIIPATLQFFDNCFVDDRDQLPKTPVTSALNWKALNTEIPFSCIFLIGAGFVLNGGMSTTGANVVIAKVLARINFMHVTVALFFLMLLVMIITNFVSNIVVAIWMCPIAMLLASVLGGSPYFFCMAAGITASFSFVLPIGTPGNLIVSRAAKIPMKQMITAGIGPSIITLIVYYLYFAFGAIYIARFL